jgi:hypothetical protein
MFFSNNERNIIAGICCLLFTRVFPPFDFHSSSDSRGKRDEWVRNVFSRSFFKKRDFVAGQGGTCRAGRDRYQFFTQHSVSKRTGI